MTADEAHTVKILRKTVAQYEKDLAYLEHVRDAAREYVEHIGRGTLTPDEAMRLERIIMGH